MKNFIWTLSGLCAAVAGFLVWSRNRQAQPVEQLAHRLEEAWADHHTRV
jgi:ribose/xylose/arabinose/galactoside ABC-type transport system permease subunit